MESFRVVRPRRAAAQRGDLWRVKLSQASIRPRCTVSELCVTPNQISPGQTELQMAEAEAEDWFLRHVAAASRKKGVRTTG